MELTVVYQTVSKNLVVLIQQKRQGDVWQTYQHSLIPKLFINAIASLPERTKSADCSFITSGGHLPPKSLRTFHHLYKESLLDDIKRVFFRYDCDCVPLFENQLGTYEACENSADTWGLKSSPRSPENQSQSQLDSTSLPVTTADDPGPSLTPTSSPPLFAGIHKINSTALFNYNYFDTALLSATQFQTLKPARVFGVTDTPKICNSPKKRLPEKSLMTYLIYLKIKFDESPQNSFV